MTKINKTVIIHIVYMIYIFLPLCLRSWSLMPPKYSSIIFFSKSHASFKDLLEGLFLPKASSIALLLDELFLWIRQISLLILSSALERGSLCALWPPCPNPWPESIGLGAGGWGEGHMWLKVREKLSDLTGGQSPSLSLSLLLLLFLLLSPSPSPACYDPDRLSQPATGALAESSHIVLGGVTEETILQRGAG